MFDPNQGKEPLFESAKYKVTQGFVHATTLRNLIQTYSDSKPWRAELDGRYSSHSAGLAWITPMPPTIMLAAGDAIHNFRSALDHCLWELWKAEGSTKDEKFINFPFGKDQSDFHHSIRSLKPATDSSRDFLRGFQAYPDGNGSDLWSLNMLDIYDKHRFINAGLAEVTVNGLLELVDTADMQPKYVPMPPAKLSIDSGLQDARLATHFGPILAGSHIGFRQRRFHAPYDISKATGEVKIYLRESQPYPDCDLCETINRFGWRAQEAVSAFERYRLSGQIIGFSKPPVLRLSN